MKDGETGPVVEKTYTKYDVETENGAIVIKTEEGYLKYLNALAEVDSSLKGVLKDDIELGEGTNFDKFSGELDGNGHSITAKSGYTTLFTTNWGTIKNLTINSQDPISVTPLARTNNGTIENCINNCEIIKSASTECGGIAGLNNGTISNCINNGNITTSRLTGGICGLNVGTIEKCLNTGIITG